MTQDKPKELESLGEAAARLLAKLVQRGNEASGGFERPEKIGAATISDHALPAVKEPGSTTGTDQKFKEPGASPAGEADAGKSLGGIANLNQRPRFVAQGGGGASEQRKGENS